MPSCSTAWRRGRSGTGQRHELVGSDGPDGYLPLLTITAKTAITAAIHALAIGNPCNAVGLVGVFIRLVGVFFGPSGKYKRLVLP